MSKATSNLQMHILPLFHWLLSRLSTWLRALFRHPKSPCQAKRTARGGPVDDAAAPNSWRSRPKPPWVRHEVLRLRALMPDNGCRKIAATFGYLHARSGESVSKSYVAKLVKAEAEAILRLRGELKNRVPRKVPQNLIWALDLTYLPTPGGGRRPVLGVIDHGSRACLALQDLTTRRTVNILRVVFELVDAFGKPRILRTDNEPIFTSRLFRASLWLLGVRHHRTAPFAPWQNGRIERLFLTLKGRLASWNASAAGVEIEQAELDLFRAWCLFSACHGGVRPHQHLDGEIVPAEAWTGFDSALHEDGTSRLGEVP